MRGRLTLIVAALLIVAAALFFGRSSGVAAVTGGITGELLGPGQNLVTAIVDPIADYLDALQQAGSLKDANSKLLRRSEELTAEVIRLRELDIENKRLRQMLNLLESSPVGRLVAAQKIGADPSNFVASFQVNRGTAGGVDVNRVVIAAAGLVGRVTQATPSTAKIVQINDPSSSVNGRVQRADSRAQGLLTGTPEGQLIMTRISQTDSIRVDDIIITSGLGGNFPAGLIVGKVVQVIQNDVELFQEAVVEPAVRFDQLEEIAVLIDFINTPPR